MRLGKWGKNSSFKASSGQEESLEDIESLASQSPAFIQGNLRYNIPYFLGRIYKGSPGPPEER